MRTTNPAQAARWAQQQQQLRSMPFGMPTRVPGQYSVDPREGATRFDPQTAFQPLQTGIGGLQNQLDTPAQSQAELIMQYLGTDAGDSGVYDQQFDSNNDGVVDLLDAQQSMQMDQGLRNPDGTPAAQTPLQPVPQGDGSIRLNPYGPGGALYDPPKGISGYTGLPSTPPPVATPPVPPVIAPPMSVTPPQSTPPVGTMPSTEDEMLAKQRASDYLGRTQAEISASNLPYYQAQREIRQQEQLDKSIEKGSVANIPGFGEVFSIPSGMSGTSRYVDASGNSIPKELTSGWGRGRHGELYLPDEYKTQQPATPPVAGTPPVGTPSNLGPFGTSGISTIDSPPRQIATPIPNASPPVPATPPVAGTPPVVADPLTTAITTPPLAPATPPLAPYTGGGYDAFGEQPYIGGVTRSETGLDATTKQMLFGLDGKGGFIPGAMQAAESTFFNADGTPRIVEEQRAGFTGDQTAGMDMARANVGSQDPFLQGAQGAFQQGVSDVGQGIERGRGYQQQGLGAIQSGIGGLRGELGGVEGIARGAAGNFGTQLGGIAGRGIGATDEFGRRLGESENLMRGTTGAYDQGLTSQFYNPYEDRVVQQTIDDVLEAGDKQDMAARARNIQTGGESAFGSRARLGASERREALGRGLGEALGGIRSRGFSEAQQTGMGEFARQRAAERAASSGLAGLSGSRLGAQQNLGSQLSGLAGAQLGSQQNLGSALTGLAGTRFGAEQVGAGALSNMGNLESQYGQSLANAQFGLGSNLQGLGTQTQQAGAFDYNQLMGQGAMQQQQAQAVIDAQRRNELQAQHAPLAQYQAVAPFVGMAPAGQFTTQTEFSPRPSALQAGLATGLGAFGAIGNFMNPRG